ncbi:D-alanyl-D-alanine carboxypeptidase [Enterovirga aerilata]|nr:D-alanyl-D-alanine carboxypeptidase [Enterovirga sp. DB1703]
MAAVVGLAASLVTADEAEARSKKKVSRKSHKANVTRASGGYSPPFAALVVDANTGRTMYAVDETAPRHPASVTKVMTLYMLFEQLERGTLSLDSELRISARAAAMAPSKIGFRPGDTISVEDAIKALVTKSANDVACAIAENLAGSEEEFAERMTRKARQLGMTSTVYRNASGLPDREQITTARDLAILGRAIQDRFPRYYKFFQTRTFHYAGRAIGNHNRLLGKIEGVDGIKTGFTNASGFNLLTSAKLNGRHVIGVVLGGKSAASRDAIMANLIRTNLAKASIGSSFASRDDDDRPEPRARVVSAAEVESASSTTASIKPGRPLELMRPAVATAPNGASTTTPSSSRPALAAAPTPPSPSQKIEARLPLLPAVPEPPARSEVALKAEPVETKRETVSRPAAVTPWVIQLAAEGDERQARAILDEARSRSGRLLAKAAPFTEKVNRGGSTLYRARFSGFSEADSAQEACRALKRNGFACFATRS